MGEPRKKKSTVLGDLEGYVVRTVGSLPPNLGLSFLQAVSEAVVDTTRTGIELARAPGRYAKGQKKEALAEPLKAGLGGVLNVMRNLTRPLKRAHQMGAENDQMLDLSDAFKKSAAQLNGRLKLLGESLTPDQKKQIAKDVKEKVKQVVPKEASRAAKNVSMALTPDNKDKVKGKAKPTSPSRSGSPRTKEQG